jgi:hypothetical protein
VAEQTVEVTNKGASATDEVEVTENKVAVTEGRVERVESHLFIARTSGNPATTPETFTRDTFEGALDKVSRPLKGRLAHVPYSSDDLIRDKRMDVELEDRDS